MTISLKCLVQVLWTENRWWLEANYEKRLFPIVMLFKSEEWNDLHKRVCVTIELSMGADGLLSHIRYYLYERWLTQYCSSGELTRERYEVTFRILWNRFFRSQLVIISLTVSMYHEIERLNAIEAQYAEDNKNVVGLCIDTIYRTYQQTKH